MFFVSLTGRKKKFSFQTHRVCDSKDAARLFFFFKTRAAMPPNTLGGRGHNELSEWELRQAAWRAASRRWNEDAARLQEQATRQEQENRLVFCIGFFGGLCLVTAVTAVFL